MPQHSFYKLFTLLVAHHIWQM